MALILQNEMRRYGIEGMFRSLDRVTVTHSFTSGEAATAVLGTGEGDGGGGVKVVLVTRAELVRGTSRRAIEELCDRRRVPLLVLIEDDDDVDPSWAASASGFLAWSELTPAGLEAAVSDAVAGRFHLSVSLARRLFSTNDQPAGRGGGVRTATLSLTAREVQVLTLVAEGLSNKQVAHRLRISENGVKRVMGNVLAKLNSPNRTLAVVRAVQLGLLAL